MKNTNRSFDVDFSPCNCLGTKYKNTGLMVISVKWKRTDSNPDGRVRFQCMRCKESWSMDNIKSIGGIGFRLDSNHPEEVDRRDAISSRYNELIAVNIGSMRTTVGTCSGRISCRKPAE